MNVICTYLMAQTHTKQEKRSRGHIQLLQYNQQQVARLGSAPQTSRVDATQTPNALSARQSSQQSNRLKLSTLVEKG